MTSDISNGTCCAPARVVDAPSGPIALAATREQTPPERVRVPGGRGLIGTNTPELAIDGEAPLRKTRIAAFDMDTTAVTNARYRAFVEATGYVSDAERLGDSFVFAGCLSKDAPPSQAVAAAPWWRMVPGACWSNPAGPGSGDTCLPDHPVVQVTWRDAQAFASWAGGRLPTEAEWEHAARGGLGDVRFPWGDTTPNETDFFPCNIWQGVFPDQNLGRDGFLGTAPVHSFAPNGYGLFNMVGNVWEYTSQPFRVKSLKKSVKEAHQGKTGFKTNKGGSFLCHSSYCYRYRIAARTGNSVDSSTSHQGFRLVYDISS